MNRTGAAVAEIDMASATPLRDGRSGRRLPRHVAIIMDGNGRWARARGLPRYEGHRRGVEALRRIVRHAGERGISHLTLFSFSSENWNRPDAEIRDLFNLMRRFVENDLAELARHNVHITVIGERRGLPDDIAAMVEKAEGDTRENDGLHLVVAFNYGGRDEIVRAAQRLGRRIADGDLDPAAIDADAMSAALDTNAIPDPDLVIRTSGEQRVSNFLLWQSAYAEFVFVPDFWPDFDGDAFDAALAEFARRDRRYGALQDD